MAKSARIIDGIAIDVFDGDAAEAFHPSVAREFVAVPDEVVVGSRLVGDEWLAPDPMPEPVEPGPPAPVFLKEISPVAFLMMYTPQERVAIRVLRKKADIDGDPLQEAAMIVDDWMKIVEDPRLTTVNLNLPQAQDGIDFLVTLGILTASRAAEIKQGIPQ